MRVQHVLPLAFGVLLAAAPLLARSEPLTVSPGDLQHLLVAESTCPTFSWAAVAGATVYELVVSAAAEESEAFPATPVLERTLRGQVSSWSPGLEECLASSRLYGWSIRARVDEQWTAWSQVRFFQTPITGAVTSEMEAVERAELARDDSRSASRAAGTRALPGGAVTGIIAEVHGNGYEPLVAVYGRADYDTDIGLDYLAGLFDGKVKVEGNLTANTFVANGYAYVSSNLTVVGNTDIYAALVGTQPYPLCMENHNGGKLMRCTSSRRFKERIRPLELPGLSTVEALQPVQFRWATGGPDLGFIAEEVAVVDPLLATFGEQGDAQGVKYRQLTAVLVKALQEQRAEFVAFRAQIEREIAELRAAGGCAPGSPARPAGW